MRFVAVSPLPSVIGTPYGFKEERREKGRKEGRKDKTFLDWSLETTFRAADSHRRISEVYPSVRLHHEHDEEGLDTEYEERLRGFWT
ncbi:hypothetical protein CgunFtcFv8_023955 [Champsocephalus gunnari]|uniref:Uncharacterized protein n=1 Tax=Champsocephalus gunnari TaxID=52237 RepID=A0AAN8DHM7_CHAGU|nr:hypothetical protein CgunFtcFv8_023955 [Champsocephalus gunnari]